MKKSLLLLLLIASPMYSAYIDTRDMTSESLRIQRLLIQLDSLNITPNKNVSGVNGSKIAMLSMMTTGLAISASSSRYVHYGYRPPVIVKPYHHKSYIKKSRTPQNKKASAIGATLAVVGAIGLAAAEVEEERQRQVELQRQETLQKIETELNSIVSNLVSTDIDFKEEDKTLNSELSQTVDQNILEIARVTSNDILILINEQETYKNDFIILTNRLSLERNQVEQQTMETVQNNIDKMNSVSSTTVKELKNINKVITKQMQTRQKEIDNQLQRETKEYNKNYPIMQRKTQSIIEDLKELQNKRIIKEAEVASEKRSKLFQTYIDRYINKLAAY